MTYVRGLAVVAGWVMASLILWCLIWHGLVYAVGTLR